MGPEPEIPREHVATLDAVLQEKAVSRMIVANVAFERHSVGTVDRHASVEAFPHRIVTRVMAFRVLGEVPVQRIAPN